MATPEVYDFPIDWYGKITSQKFNLRSMNQVAATSWNGAGAAIAGPHTQVWLCDMVIMPLRDPALQDLDAFFSRLRGRAGVVRLGNGARLAPWNDRNLTPTTSTWSDGSTFTDGSGFSSGFLPPEVYLVNAAAKGARYITLGGFPASFTAALRRGDLLQIKPNGIPGSVPHLYKAMYGGDSNSAGQIGLAIEPGLRAGVAAGDVVGLRNATTLFRLLDDTQFEVEITGAGMGNCGGSLIEALDLVP